MFTVANRKQLAWPADIWTCVLWAGLFFLRSDEACGNITSHHSFILLMQQIFIITVIKFANMCRAIWENITSTSHLYSLVVNIFVVFYWIQSPSQILHSGENVPVAVTIATEYSTTCGDRAELNLNISQVITHTLKQLFRVGGCWLSWRVLMMPMPTSMIPPTCRQVASCGHLRVWTSCLFHNVKTHPKVVMSSRWFEDGGFCSYIPMRL